MPGIADLSPGATFPLVLGVSSNEGQVPSGTLVTLVARDPNYTCLWQASADGHGTFSVNGDDLGVSP